MSIRKMFLAAAACFALAATAFAQSPAQVDIDPFFATLDVNEDGFIGKGEWKELGLMDAAFPLCDSDKDEKITKQEMAACAVPESMDPKKEGVLTVYSGGRFVISSPGAPFPKPANAPPGITQATQMVSDSPYVEGGPTGQDFILLFDADGDGKVSHMEWEKLKNQTVFKPYRWPQYNRNRDEWITVDEAPKAPAGK
ncbi:MAG: Secreted protein acidic and rich in cysteine Ca binding region [Acidobacteria bacterium]|nr:Secreted protein acidic and rich in cysteine Ca binding region [Acidobacteriota bacterium]